MLLWRRLRVNMVVQNYNELIMALEKVRDDIMQNDVAQRAEELMSENVQTHVYDAYQSHYPRTGKLGGDAIQTQYIDGYLPYLVLYNLRYDDAVGGGKRYVSAVVESGKGYWNKTLDDKIGARPFAYYTKMDLMNGKFRQFVQEALQSRGFKTT